MLWGWCATNDVVSKTWRVCTSACVCVGGVSLIVSEIVLAFVIVIERVSLFDRFV